MATFATKLYFQAGEIFPYDWIARRMPPPLEKIKLLHMITPFLLLIAGLVVASVALLVELIIGRKRVSVQNFKSKFGLSTKKQTSRPAQDKQPTDPENSALGSTATAKAGMYS